MAEHIPGKPRVGTFVDYFNPKLMQRIGYTAGYGGRGAGPYAALVTNNVGHGVTLTVFLPEVTPLEFRAVPYQEKDLSWSPADGTNIPDTPGNGYWDWQSPTQAARAAKEIADAVRALAKEQADEGTGR